MEVLGKKHIEYASSFNGLAGLYETTGAYDKAETRYLECIAIAPEVLGTKHIDYALSLNSWVGWY